MLQYGAHCSLSSTRAAGRASIGTTQPAANAVHSPALQGRLLVLQRRVQAVHSPALQGRLLVLQRRVQRPPHVARISAQGRGHLSGHLRPPRRPSPGSLRRRAGLALEHQPVGLVGSELRRHLRCVAPACVRMSVESKDAPAPRPDVEVQCHAALLPISLQLSTRAAPIERRRPRLWNHARGHRRRRERGILGDCLVDGRGTCGVGFCRVEKFHAFRGPHLLTRVRPFFVPYHVSSAPPVSAATTSLRRNRRRRRSWPGDPRRARPARPGRCRPSPGTDDARRRPTGAVPRRRAQ